MSLSGKKFREEIKPRKIRRVVEHSHEDWKRAMKAALKEESKIEHTKD